MEQVQVLLNRSVTLAPGASALEPDGSPRVTWVFAVTSTRLGTSPLPPTLTVLSWIWLTKVTVPPLSTEATGGVRSRMATVTDAAAVALGAISTENAATPTQARTAVATPRRAVRRIRPDAIFRVPPHRAHVRTGQ